MEQRSRKKRRSAVAAAPRRRAAATPGLPAGTEAVDAEPTTEHGYYARQRARDEEARARLQPLAPGERPRSVTVAAVLAGLLAVANLVLLATGWQIDGREPQTASTLGFAALMAAGAAAIWQRRYWAVLAFEALLAITVLFAFLALLTASNARAALLCAALIGGCGTLFWHLVRAMARLQLPDRPTG